MEKSVWEVSHSVGCVKMHVTHNDGKQLSGKMTAMDVLSRVLKVPWSSLGETFPCFPCLKSPQIKKIANIAAKNLSYHRQIPVQSVP